MRTNGLLASLQVAGFARAVSQLNPVYRTSFNETSFLNSSSILATSSAILPSNTTESFSYPDSTTVASSGTFTEQAISKTLQNATVITTSSDAVNAISTSATSSNTTDYIVATSSVVKNITTDSPVPTFPASLPLAFNTTSSNTTSPASVVCKRYYVARSGDSCATVATIFSISVEDFVQFNSALQSCDSLETGTAYCVSLESEAATTGTANGSNTTTSIGSHETLPTAQYDMLNGSVIVPAQKMSSVAGALLAGSMSANASVASSTSNSSGIADVSAIASTVLTSSTSASAVQVLSPTVQTVTREVTTTEYLTVGTTEIDYATSFLHVANTTDYVTKYVTAVLSVMRVIGQVNTLTVDSTCSAKTTVITLPASLSPSIIATPGKSSSAVTTSGKSSSAVTTSGKSSSGVTSSGKSSSGVTTSAKSSSGVTTSAKSSSAVTTSAKSSSTSTKPSSLSTSTYWTTITKTVTVDGVASTVISSTLVNRVVSASTSSTKAATTSTSSGKSNTASTSSIKASTSSTLSEKASTTSSVIANKAVTSSSSTSTSASVICNPSVTSIIRANRPQPTVWCNTWEAGRPHANSPFPKLSPVQVSNACGCILAQGASSSSTKTSTTTVVLPNSSTVKTSLSSHSSSSGSVKSSSSSTSAKSSSVVSTGSVKSSSGTTTVSVKSSSSTCATASPPAATQTGVVSGCTEWYVAKAGDYCYLIAQEYNIDVDTFMEWNPAVNAPSCNNVQIGDAYCVAVGCSSSASSSSSTLTVTAGSGTSKSSTATSSSASSTATVVSYKTYKGNGTVAAGWPAQSQWLDFDTLFSLNTAIMQESCLNNWNVPNDTPTEIAALKTAIQSVGAAQNVDPRFILAITMQESNGCVRVITTNYGVRNPGLMQDHNGNGTCNDDGTVQTPCPDSEIYQMIEDGTAGTSSGDGLVQCLQESGVSDVSKYYRAARIYNGGTGGYVASDLGEGCCTACYASDVANRLVGWHTGSSGCSL